MPAKPGGSGPTSAKDTKILYDITMMTSNACDAGRLQAEQRKRSKYRIVMIPSNASDASWRLQADRPKRSKYRCRYRCRNTHPDKAIQMSLKV
jgi:hypothetical protein